MDADGIIQQHCSYVIMGLGSQPDSYFLIRANGISSLTLRASGQWEEAPLPCRVVVKMGDRVSQTNGICHYLIVGTLAASHWEVNTWLLMIYS